MSTTTRRAGLGFVLAAMLAGRTAALADPFVLVILPDTQKYSIYYPAIFDAQTRWIAQQAAAQNIVFVLHEGDITENNTAPQWERARSSMDLLAGIVPYSVLPGNHDMGPYGGALTRNTSFFNLFFPLSEQAAGPTFGGAFPPGSADNTYHLLTAGGTDWLILSLEFGPRDATLGWANNVANQWPDRRLIVVTHDYLYNDGSLHSQAAGHNGTVYDFGVAEAPGGVNDGQQMWDVFVSQHRNIQFVFNGHVTGSEARRQSAGNHGNTVYQMLANYQAEANGGNGFLRVLTFDPDARSVDVATYSPSLDAYKTDAQNAFTLEDIYLGPLDTTPPSVPAGLAIAAATDTSLTLIWNAAVDAESGVARYDVRRDGAPFAAITDTTWADSGLGELSTHVYSIAAVNNDGLRSAYSPGVAGMTLPDTTPPELTAIEPVPGNPTVLLLRFSEPVEATGAATVGNYAIDGGVRVTLAAPLADPQVVLLHVSPLVEGQAYQLTVTGITDQALTPNPLGPGAGLSFTYAAELMFDSFEDGLLDGWLVADVGTFAAPSAWGVVDGRAVQSSNIHGPAPFPELERLAPFAASTPGGPTVTGGYDGSTVWRFPRHGTLARWSAATAGGWSDYRLEATLASTDDDVLGVAVRFTDRDNHYRLELDGTGDETRLLVVFGGAETVLASAPGSFELGVDVGVELIVVGDSLRALIDEVDVFGGPVSDTRFRTGTVALFAWANAGSRFDDIIVWPAP